MAKSDGSEAAKARVTFIGYGEAGQAFAAGMRANFDLDATTYDIKVDHGGKAAERHRAICDADGTRCASRVAEAVEGGDIILSLVTAAEALNAARSVSGLSLEDRYYLDCNSCSPQTKGEAAAVIEEAGGRYLDVAVMSPVHPRLHRAPMLVSGPHAAKAIAAMEALDMRPDLAAGPVGTASAIKLCRSVVVKGIEAISAEMILAARTLGVEADVLASLERSYPGFDWAERGAYALDRMIVHGKRRSDEMDEAAKMLQSLGLSGGMSAATADWQRQIGGLGLEAGKDDLLDRADRMREALGIAGETGD